MEPDVIRIYSSSPPPLEDAAEEGDEEFGDFGGFSGVVSSVSFSEFDSSKGFGQSHVADASPPGHFGTVATSLSPDFALGVPGKVSGVAQLQSDCEPCNPGCSHTSPLSESSFGSEAVRKPAPREQAADARRTESRARGCNGDNPAVEVLTNGFAPFDVEDTPVVRPKKRGPAAKPALDCCGHRSVPNSTQMATPRLCSQLTDTREYSNGLPEGKYLQLQSGTGLKENGDEDSEHSPGPASLTMAQEGLNNGASGSYSGQCDPEFSVEHRSTRPDPIPPVQNGVKEWQGSVCCRTEEAGEEGRMEDECAFGPGRVSESLSDDFASFCQAVSPDGLEDFGDFRAKGFAAPPFPAGGQPPPDHADKEGSFEDLGQTGPGVLDTAADFAAEQTVESTREGAFVGPEGCEREDEDGRGDFPGSDSFADFASAPMGAEAEDTGGWNAFGQPEEPSPGGGSSWATFREEQGCVLTHESEKTSWDAAVTAPPSGSPQTCRRDSLSVALAGRLERLFRAAFPQVPGPEAGGGVPCLRALLEPPDGQPEPGAEPAAPSHSREPWDVWWRLQDIHDAFGLRFQWGGSHSNTALLCSLGIDTRNIGMLETTKEPTSPLSAAEKMASIAQAPFSSPETNTSPESTQEALLPIQFDWSSSGLTNPLDAKLETCGSGILPDGVSHLVHSVEKTRSSSRPRSGSRIQFVGDGYVSLVSDGYRNPRPVAALSEEAGQVMKALPDLSFMQARVLAFPVTIA